MSICDLSHYIKFSEGRNYSSSFRVFSWYLEYDKLLKCAANGNEAFKNFIFKNGLFPFCIPSVSSGASNTVSAQEASAEGADKHIHTLERT